MTATSQLLLGVLPKLSHYLRDEVLSLPKHRPCKVISLAKIPVASDTTYRQARSSFLAVGNKVIVSFRHRSVSLIFQVYLRSVVLLARRLRASYGAQQTI